MNEQLLKPNPPAQAAIPQPAPPQPPPPQIRPVTLVFVGPIQNPASKNLRAACCNFVTNGTKEIQILFSSTGGDVNEAFSLHNFLRGLPIRLAIHCIGSVDSAAMCVFLAGARRFCCPDSTFLFHDFATNFPTPGNVTRIQFSELFRANEGFRLRSQELLKNQAAFTDEDFKALQLYDKPMIYDARFAKEKGIVQEIKETSIPAGSILANIDL
jgi:ATP-dependent protease ClpP protease subunit